MLSASATTLHRERRSFSRPRGGGGPTTSPPPQWINPGPSGERMPPFGCSRTAPRVAHRARHLWATSLAMRIGPHPRKPVHSRGWGLFRSCFAWRGPGALGSEAATAAASRPPGATRRRCRRFATSPRPVHRRPQASSDGRDGGAWRRSHTGRWLQRDQGHPTGIAVCHPVPYFSHATISPCLPRPWARIRSVQALIERPSSR